MNTIIKFNVAIVMIFATFFISCSPYEEDFVSNDLHTNQVKNHTKELRSFDFGFKEYEIIDFKEENFFKHQFEPKEISEQFKKAEEKILSYKQFPNQKNYSSSQLADYVANFGIQGAYIVNFSFDNLYRGNFHGLSLKDVYMKRLDNAKKEDLNDAFNWCVQVYFDVTKTSLGSKQFLKLYTPYEVYQNESTLEKKAKEDKKGKVGELWVEKHMVDLNSYARFTGIPVVELFALRKKRINYSFNSTDSSPITSNKQKYVIIFPIKKLNIGLGYSKIPTNPNNLKAFIKKGTIITVKFNRPNVQEINFNSYHSFMVLDKWYDLPKGKNSKDIKIGNKKIGYLDYPNYKTLGKNEDFSDIQELQEDIGSDISLCDYLKRFLFVEAGRTSYDHNIFFSKGERNKIFAGNDSVFQNQAVHALQIYENSAEINIGLPLSRQYSSIHQIKNHLDNYKDIYWTEIYISNPSYSILSSMPDLPYQVCKNAHSYLGINYDLFLGKSYQHCSGLVYWLYRNEKNLPYLNIVTKKLPSLDEDRKVIPMELVENPYMETYYINLKALQPEWFKDK